MIDTTTNLHALPQHTYPDRSVAFGLALDTLCAVDVRGAASDVSFTIKDVDVGLEADLGTLTQMPKLVENAFPLHEFALSAHTVRAEEAQRLLGLVSCGVPGLQAKVVGRKSPAPIVEIERLITNAFDHLCVFFLLLLPVSLWFC